MVELDIARVYAEDCVHCEEPRAMIDRIQRRITLAGPLDAAQRARLAEIAKKCPVHKTLVAGLRVEDEIVVAALDGADAWKLGQLDAVKAAR